MSFPELAAMVADLIAVVAEGKVRADNAVQVWNSCGVAAARIQIELNMYNDLDAMNKKNMELTKVIEALKVVAAKEAAAFSTREAVSLKREEKKDVQLLRYAIAAGRGAGSGIGSGSLECKEEMNDSEQDDQELDRLAAHVPTLAAVSFKGARARGALV